MDFDSDMARDEAHDPFGICGRHAAARILKPARQPVDPGPAVEVEHHLDDAGVFQICRNRWPKRGAQHARATGEGNEAAVTTNPANRLTRRQMDQQG